MGLGDFQREAPELLCKILPSCKVQLPLLEVQRGLPYDLTKTDEFEQDLSLDGFETAWKNSFLISHRMLSVQSTRRNVISGVELRRNGPFSGELPWLVYGVIPV